MSLLNDFQVLANCQKYLLWSVGATGLPLLSQLYPPDPAGLKQKEPILAEELYIFGPHTLNAAPGLTRPLLIMLFFLSTYGSLTSSGLCSRGKGTDEDFPDLL